MVLNILFQVCLFTLVKSLCQSYIHILTSVFCFFTCWVWVGSLSPTRFRLLGLGTSATELPIINPQYHPYFTSHMFLKCQFSGQELWCMPLIPELEWQRQDDLCKFKAILVYISSSRLAMLHDEILYQNKTKEREAKDSATFVWVWLWMFDFFFLNSFLCPSCPG